MGKAKVPSQSSGSGEYVGQPFSLVDHPKFRGLELRDKAILAAIQRSFTGFNNGRICVTRDEIAERIGNHNHKANMASIGRLIKAGFLTAERTYPRGSRLATEYRLTYFATGKHPNLVPATREYERVGDLPRSRRAQPRSGEKVNVSRDTIEHEDASSGSTVEHDGKSSGSMIEPHQVKKLGSSGSIIEQHISINHGSEQKRPDVVAPDRWRAAGRRAAENPSAPDAEILRRKVADHILKLGHGSQGRLAKAAGIPPGTFSRFRRGDFDLSNGARVNLACALQRIAGEESKLKLSLNHKSRQPRPARQSAKDSQP